MNTKFILTASLLSLAAGCTVGPTYKQPQVKVDDQWSQSAPSGVAYDKSPVALWWTTFNDPVLDSLVSRAAIANLDLKAATARLREARAQRGVTASALFPNVDVTSQYERSRRSANTGQAGNIGANSAGGLSRDLESDLFQAGFDMSWEIDFFGRVRRSVEAADANVDSAAADRRAVLVSLLGEVGRNYVELRGFQRRLEITRQNIGVQQSATELTRSRFEAGLTTELDVQQALAQLSNTQAAVPSLEASVRRSMHRLSVLLGMQPGALIAELESPGGPGVIPGAPAEVPVGLPSELLRRRPDIQKAERDVAAATARVGVATADLFPRFSLTGSFGLQSDKLNNFADADSRFWSIGPSLRWPLLDWGRVRANIAVQDAQTEQAIAQYEKTVLTSLEEVENALTDYDRERVRYQSLAAAEQASRRAVELAEQQYTSGLSDFLNVLQTQRTMFDSQDQLVQSEKAVSANLIALYKSLGGGWEIEKIKVENKIAANKPD